MSTVELWTSGACDVFGYRFRDHWHVVGWEQGNVPEGYVCWLKRDPVAAALSKPQKEQMELFA
jgi:hypothetical protein